MFAKYRETGNWEVKSTIMLFFEKPVTRKNPTPLSVFAAHPSNFEQTLTTKLPRASRSRIFEFASQIFLQRPKFKISTRNLTFKKF